MRDQPVAKGSKSDESNFAVQIQIIIYYCETGLLIRQIEKKATTPSNERRAEEWISI